MNRRNINNNNTGTLPLKWTGVFIVNVLKKMKKIFQTWKKEKTKSDSSRLFIYT